MQGSSQHARTHPGHVVVIGGGIAGLAAAHRLLGTGLRVTVLEATDRLGGKLMTGEVAGVQVDLGAESMLARRPEAVGLARAAGLGDRLQPPATATASVWTRDALQPMPKGHVMGVPGDPEALAGLLSPEGIARIAAERDLPPAEVGDDVAVGEYVAGRLGREVVDRLVEPLLGGVYAGDAYRISLRAAVPQLFEVARAGGPLLDGVRAIQERAAARQQTGPVFQGLAGGIGTLPGAVADAVRAGGAEIRTETPVLGLTRTGGDWTVLTDTGVLTADGIVLATPAWSASALLAAESPAVSAELAAVEYASMALITMAFRRSDLASVPALEGRSGFLVPPVDGRTIKASTFSSNKWRWVADAAPDLFVLRTSVGRYGDEAHLHREDGELVDVSLGDLATATGLTAKPVDSTVTRWIGGLPQYPVGHLDRVARIRAGVEALPGLRLCGAVYDGVGIPACVASAHRAADELVRDLAGESAGRRAAGETAGEIIATPTPVPGTRDEAGE
ncbi:protoporphyrinogen oxidase [uncultured Streptomyces sp.]|uniref:protoporphyrinogen oxidase n=1 Tax=uncultured Streptomyces sp. TaxID=174707 RepID=UPI00262E7C8D|nr:protoporphyrinogen oxidase [uncultured Streptomyces sp.]